MLARDGPHSGQADVFVTPLSQVDRDFLNKQRHEEVYQFYASILQGVTTEAPVAATSTAEPSMDAIVCELCHRPCADDMQRLLELTASDTLCRRNHMLCWTCWKAMTDVTRHRECNVWACLAAGIVELESQ